MTADITLLNLLIAAAAYIFVSSIDSSAAAELHGRTDVDDPPFRSDPALPAGYHRILDYYPG